MYTTADLFNSALSVFSGTNANAFSDKNQMIWDALREVRRNVDIQESQRNVPLNPVMINGEFLYAEPCDVDVPLGIYPVQGRSAGDRLNDFNRVSSDYLDNSYQTRGLSTEYTREYRMGIPLLRINAGAAPTSDIIINNFTSLTEGGSITVGGDASDANISNVWYLTDNGALSFDITQNTGVSSVEVIMTGTDIKDISDISIDGAFTASVFIPRELVGHITNIKLRLGNDAGTYIEGVVTANSYNGAFTEGFNDIIIPRRSMVPTGAVNDTAIAYAGLFITHTMAPGTTAGGVRVDNIKACYGFGMIYRYYSKYLFMNTSTGAFLEKPTAAGLSDKMLINKDTFDLAVLELRKILDMKRAGSNQGDIWRNAQRDLFGLQGVKNEEGAYAKYKRRFPSARQPQITRWSN